jgi:hypothetical protein
MGTNFMSAGPENIDEAGTLPEDNKNVRFNYIKSPLFRTFHVDGLIGGPTPRGLLHFAVFSERRAIPQITEHAITKDGSLGEQIGSRGKLGFVREMDADLVMTIHTAKEMRDWLNKNIEFLESIINK